MKRYSWLPWLLSLPLLSALTACGSSIKTQRLTLAPAFLVIAPAPTPVTTPPVVPVEDPVLTLIARSQERFLAGRRELDLGHLARAKSEFNAALEVLLESPYGARTEPRIREHFDQLVDRISTYELTALAVGDGFTEKQYEPASIDELLALTTFEPVGAPSAGLETTVATDLQSTSHDIPIPLNARVLRYIELFQGKLRDWIQDGLQRGSQYLPMIQDVFRAEGLPLDLAYVPLIESAFKPNALSRAKAKGVWQFMRQTGLENGLKQDWYIDERQDPEKSTLAAARYLRTLSELFKGDWHLALASYNGGPGRVQRVLGRTGLPDFWSLSSRPRLLPNETREYVPMILAAIVIARNPAQYGFDVTPASPLPYETVSLPRPVDLRRIAEWTGASIADIQTLNPELRRWTTPVRSPNYELRVPEGTAVRVRDQLENASEAELATLKWYTVKRGESLLSISQKLRVNRTELAEANYLSTKGRVSAGRKLVIPNAPTTVLAARAERPVPVAESRAVVPTNTMLSVAPTGERSETARLIYRVKTGDTLSSIARLHNTTVALLKRWNKLGGTRINPGDRLTIFASRRSRTQESNPAS